MKRSILFICILFISLTACKKYPDGPLISLRTKEHRLVGTWDVESYTVDGIDSTAYLKNHPFYGIYIFEDGEGGVGDFKYKTNDNSFRTAGHWMFKNNKKDLETSLSLFGGSYNLEPYLASDVTWEIRRLKEKELWLKTTFNGKEYFIKFKH